MSILWVNQIPLIEKHDYFSFFFPVLKPNQQTTLALKDQPTKKQWFGEAVFIFRLKFAWKVLKIPGSLAPSSGPKTPVWKRGAQQSIHQSE